MAAGGAVWGAALAAEIAAADLAAALIVCGAPLRFIVLDLVTAKITRIGERYGCRGGGSYEC